MKKRPPDQNSLCGQVVGFSPSNTTRTRCVQTNPLLSRNRTKTSHSPEVALFLPFRFTAPRKGCEHPQREQALPTTQL